jgi:hypothetical protein
LNFEGIFLWCDNNSDPICIKRGEEEGPIWAIGWWCCSVPSVLIMSINLQKWKLFLDFSLKKKREEKPQTEKASCQLVPFIEICETSRKCKEHLGEIFLGHLEGTLYTLLVPPQK